MVTGPTCSGKEAVAYAVARRLDAEIISLDSMKVYRHLDIGTAKPPASHRRTVPYHLIDVVDPVEEYSVGRYVREALEAAGGCFGRGRRAVFCGGTPLYLWGLVRGFCRAPGGDPAVRAELERRVDTDGLDALHRELARVDPAAAGRIHPNDRRRVVRALEVHVMTGMPFTEFRRDSAIRLPSGTYALFGLMWPRERLSERIDRRVDRMVEAGLLAEADEVAARFPRVSRTAGQCIGYRQIWEGRRRGEPDGRIIALIKRDTRRFSRKQGTWFRRFPEIRWLAAADRDPEEIAEEIVRLLEHRPRALPEG